MSKSPLNALIVDGSSPARLSISTILQGFGISKIENCSTVADARRKVLDGKYDIILCEYHFDGDETGQDLLEQLSERHQLPPPTIFIMVTGEAKYSRVASVAEVTPDDYLLKPVQTGQLEDRIERAFTRREALMDIYDALYAKEYGRALNVAQQMLSGKTRYFNEVAKLAVQTLCRLERYEDATVFYRRIVERKHAAWAKFGLARMSLKTGDKEVAETMLLDVINQHLRYLPVYDQLIDFYLEEGRQADALGILERSIVISPRSNRRLQLAGQLAFELGLAVQADTYLNRAIALRGSTIELDFRTLLHLVILKFDEGETGSGVSLVKQMQTRLKQLTAPVEAQRATWYCNLAMAAQAIASREPVAAIDLMRSITGQAVAETFDFTLAQDYLTIIARLYSNDLAQMLTEWVRPLIQRYLTSQARLSMMLPRVAGCEQLTAVMHGTAATLDSDVDAPT
ncbi:response regulator [Chitinimonas arctica]|nr:response regulator [Chitinimonas arctica]